VSLAVGVQAGGLLGVGWWLLVQVGRAGRCLLERLGRYREHGAASLCKRRLGDRAAAEDHLRGLAGPR
jgi:hypothetical protein